MKLEIKDVIWLSRLLSKPLGNYNDGCGCCADNYLSALHDGDDDFEERRKAILETITIPPSEEEVKDEKT